MRPEKLARGFSNWKPSVVVIVWSGASKRCTISGDTKRRISLATYKVTGACSSWQSALLPEFLRRFSWRCLVSINEMVQSATSAKSSKSRDAAL